MDNTNGITPVMPIGGMGDSFGGSFLWIFGLLILLGMFNGGGLGWGNNGFADSTFNTKAAGGQTFRFTQRFKVIVYVEQSSTSILVRINKVQIFCPTPVDRANLLY